MKKILSVLLFLFGLLQSQQLPVLKGNVPILYNYKLGKSDSVRKTLILPRTATGDMTRTYKIRLYGDEDYSQVMVYYDLAEDSTVFGWRPTRTTIAQCLYGTTLTRAQFAPTRYPFNYLRMVLISNGYADSARVWMTMQSQVWRR